MLIQSLCRHLGSHHASICSTRAHVAHVVLHSTARNLLHLGRAWQVLFLLHQVRLEAELMDLMISVRGVVRVGSMPLKVALLSRRLLCFDDIVLG